MDAKTLIAAIRENQSLHKHYTAQLKEYKDEQDRLKANILVLESEKDKLQNIAIACKMIIEKITYNSKAKLEQFLTYALQSIFTDKNYELVLNIKEDTKRPSLEILLKEDGTEQEITDAVGGGILSTLGLLMQIYYLEVYGLSKVMFIDEGLKEVSTGNTLSSESNVNYLSNVLQFLKYLSKEKEYKFVIITHDNNVRQLADTIYEVKNGSVVQVA